MKVVIQRVSEASVMIDGNTKSSIKAGCLVLLGITIEDNIADADWLMDKIGQLRIYSDAAGLMNLSLEQINGEALLISQFTLLASTKKGNRPSYISAARPEQAIPLYEYAIRRLENALGKSIMTGEFGADMKVSLVNDGPVTIIIDSKNRE
ncbi:MAG: D-aminoacyl-tRNA deacylase [Saprospiraceae bacterium]